MGITRKEALDCFASDDLIGIGMEADAIRRRLHPEGVVSYTIEGRVDSTSLGPKSGFEHVAAAISDLTARDGTAISLHAEPTPAHAIENFEDLFRTIKQRFPNLWLHCLSAGEILSLSEHSRLSLHDTIERLREAGLDSIPGDDAGILDDAVQHPDSRRRRKAEDWVAVHRTAHTLGIQTTAAMTFGAGETAEHRVHHLETLRELQQETGGFASFTPWTSTPRAASAQGFEEATAVEYLKTLAISRMVLDNIPNVQSHLETQGLKVLQVSLRFGANDAGSLPLSGSTNYATEEQIRQVIRDAGFRPVQRDTLYRTMFLT